MKQPVASGRYEYVSTLIGISQNGHPVAGVISEPYSYWATPCVTV